MERFVDPKAGHRQQAKHGGIRRSAEVLGGGQRGGTLEERGDIVIAKALGRFPPVPLADQVRRRDFRTRV